MFTQIKDDLSVYFFGAMVLIVGLLNTVSTVDVRLTDGQAENQGRVEVRKHANEKWGQVCDMNFGDNEAAAVCRQLNYKYSRKDDQVYKPNYYDFKLENFNCDALESNFSNCIDDEWKTGFGRCDTKINAYASVCCSNSSTFGEMHDGIFVSHCADSWVDAEEICEEKKATLASFNEYKDLMGTVLKPTETEDKDDKGYWTKKFFTPWIWSNGCFSFTSDTFQYHEFNLDNNTVQACLQMCSIESEPSSFLLSGQTCRCLPAKSARSNLTEVLPGWCNKKCLGDSTFFCGSGLSGPDSYWSLYTIASEDIFYKISDPQTNQHKQCAILEFSRKLSSENCYKRVGYICGQISQENSSLPKLMFFQNSPFYEVYMQEARMRCTNTDSTMRLIGENILEQDVFFAQPFVNLWVDISRVLAEVYTIYWKPKNLRDTSLWRNLEPKWCLATHHREAIFSDEVTACQTRFLYICSLNNRKGQSSTENGSSSQNSNDTGSLSTIILAVVCGLLVGGIMIVTIFFYIRRRKKQRGQSDNQCQSQYTRSPQNEYDASVNVNPNSQEHVYSELKPSSENIYNEIDALLSDTEKTESPQEEAKDINNEGKELVTMKKSYSCPKDLQNMIDGQDDKEFKDANYIYPYDKIQRSDTDDMSSNKIEENTHEKGDNEITDPHNKHTVV